jgi:hypothetical protein
VARNLCRRRVLSSNFRAAVQSRACQPGFVRRPKVSAVEQRIWLADGRRAPRPSAFTPAMVPSMRTMEPEKAQTAQLADLLLKVDGEVFGTSWPEKGDVTRSELDGHLARRLPKLSFGASALDVHRLEQLTGKVARVLDLAGRELARIRIEKVDPQVEIVVGTLLSEGAPGRADGGDCSVCFQRYPEQRP